MCGLKHIFSVVCTATSSAGFRVNEMEFVRHYFNFISN